MNAHPGLTLGLIFGVWWAALVAIAVCQLGHSSAPPEPIEAPAAKNISVNKSAPVQARSLDVIDIYEEFVADQKAAAAKYGGGKRFVVHGVVQETFISQRGIMARLSHRRDDNRMRFQAKVIAAFPAGLEGDWDMGFDFQFRGDAVVIPWRDHESLRLESELIWRDEDKSLSLVRAKLL